jgi:hypothetical protein
MPFGLINAPTTFMILMDDILRPFTNYFVVIYLDVILIFTKSWQEHLQHIQYVLSNFQQRYLYANLEKFSFGMTRVEYIGDIVDENGVHVDPTNIQSINDWPAPKTLTELHNFLGLTNFYHKLLFGFSHISWPLSQVNKGGRKGKFVCDGS